MTKIEDINDIQPLIKYLNSKNHLVRRSVALVLKKINWSPSNIIQKIKFLFALQNFAKIKKIGEKSINILIEALNDNSPIIRINTILVLKEIGDLRVVRPFIKKLKDPDQVVRWLAAEALGRFENKEAIEPLIEALKDDYWKVRNEAVKSLGEIGENTVKDHLIQALNDENSVVRSNAIKALKNMGYEGQY
jgi:HEAT repeat protein